MKLVFFTLLLIALPETRLWSEEKASPAEEVVEIQGIKIWRKGSPTNAYTTIGNESLMNVTQPEAQNRIALGVRARKGNAAIITSMTASQRLDITQNTGINRLDGLNVRYTIIQLKP